MSILSLAIESVRGGGSGGLRTSERRGGSVTSCRFVATDQPRMLRTHVRDCNASGCEGCMPCQERHCTTCGRRHIDGLRCASCVGDVRQDISQIVALTDRMLPEAMYRGVNSEAAHLEGPTADPNAWRQRRRYGYRDVVETKPNGDRFRPDVIGEDHPLWVLGTWDLLVTEHYGHHRTQRVTVATAAAYLKANLTELAQDADFPFEELAREVRECRGHLEDVLRDGERDERGGLCPMCGDAALVLTHATRQAEPCDCGPRPALRHADHGPCTCGFRLRIEWPSPDEEPVTVRIYDDELACDGHRRDDLACVACQRQTEWDERHRKHADDDPEEDRWVCPKCHASYTEHDYQTKVAAVYVLHAGVLTASDIAHTYRIAEGTVRQWANRGQVRKHGRDAAGRMLYDVADVKRLTGRDTAESA